MLHHGDDVGCVSAARALSVVGVDGAVAEGADGLLDEAGFVERVGVDQALHVVVVAYGETGVDGGGCGAPVLVEFEAAGAGGALLSEALGVAVVALAGDAEIEGQLVTGLKHLTDEVLAGRAGCGVCSGAANSLDRGSKTR